MVGQKGAAERPVGGCLKGAALEALSESNKAALVAKLHSAGVRDTPARRPRPEAEAAALARDVINHHLVRQALPYLLIDGTNLTGTSWVVLADADRSSVAVLALKHVPPTTGATAVAGKLQAARALAAQRAEECSAAMAAALGGPPRFLSVGVCSNVGGLEWCTPPPSPLRRALSPLQPASMQGAAGSGSAVGRLRSALQRVLRWAAAAVGVAVLAAVVAAQK